MNPKLQGNLDENVSGRAHFLAIELGASSGFMFCSLQVVIFWGAGGPPFSANDPASDCGGASGGEHPLRLLHPLVGLRRAQGAVEMIPEMFTKW